MPPARMKVRLRVPRGRLFVGSYHRVPVEIAPRAGLTFDDLEFVVPDGAKAGLVSPSRDARFDPKRPHLMLLTGYEPGTYVVEARLKSTNDLVAEAKFTVDTRWKDEDEDAGPGRWFTGITGGYAAGAAWGGGPAGPENVGVVAATGTRRIAILLVDTSSQRFTADAAELQGHRDRWTDELVDGVAHDGTTHSSKLFYEEVSYGNFSLSAQAFGPVSLSQSWDDCFNADGTPKGAYFQACFTAGDALIDYDDFDTLLCVSQSVTGPPATSAWPYASIGNWGPYTTADGNKNYGVISMPNEWGVSGDRKIHETFSHELGHNLGLGDQYTPAVPGRNPGGWEMMHDDDDFPHFSIAHRMMLGWVQPGWLQTFNFQSMAAPVDQTVELEPIEHGAPAAGRRTGVEVRIADGWNYYFEYRIGQAVEIADRHLPTDSRVLGTDVVSPPYVAPIARPTVLLLNNDNDGDGAVLGNGQDYEETDTTDPVYPTDFAVDVSGIDGSKADVRVRYGVNSRPDPSIRPWPAAPDRQWQSPDIEIRNVRNQADPAWFNVPWVGNANTVVAKVKNNGGLDAPQVRVNFYVKNYNVGGTPETFLGFDRHDVAAGATVEFTTSWVPPSTGHFCIVVRIPLYQLPANPAVVEMTELNNVAQSNYDRFISTTSTPSRELTEVEVGNPYDIRTRIWLMAGHSNPLYRTYLEHAWLYLDPGETRTVDLMYEYAPDHLRNDVYPPEERRTYRKLQKVPNRVAFASYIEDPRDDPRHAIAVLSGAQAEVVTGKGTRFEKFSVDGRAARGTIVTAEDGKGVPGGKVVLRVSRRKQGDDESHYETVTVRAGSFSAKLGGKGRWVQAFYIPRAGYGACESKVVSG